MKKTRTFVAVIVALAVLCGVLAIGWIASNNQSLAYAGRLESGYQKSFSELITNVNSIEVNLSKALISSDDSKKQEIYQRVNQLCNLCATNLSNLPINHQSIVETTKFINQLGGFSYYLSQKLKTGDTMTQNDTASVNDLYNWCVYVQGVINDFANNLTGDFDILKNTNMGDASTDFDQMFSKTSATGMEFPTLIYDGPFSDSIKNKEIKGLENFDVSIDDAKQILLDAFAQYNVSDLKFAGEVKGKFEAYHFTFNTPHRSYFADITKKGGLLLSVASSGTLAGEKISLLDAETEAQNFARRLGIKNMFAVWSTNLGGVAYVNLVPIQNEVMIYPDMIKAKVSLDTGSILGWEAQSYAYNHTERDDFDFAIDKDVAQKMIGNGLVISTIKKCIVPKEYGGEELCYEFKCTYNNYTYYVYISGKTGLEVNTLRVVKTSSGDLLE